MARTPAVIRPVIRRVTRARGAAAILVAFSTVLSGCGKSSTKGDALALSTREFSIAASTQEVPAGNIKLRVDNKGKIVHEIVAFRTDLAEGSLPLTADGLQVDEAASGLTHMDPEAEDVAADQVKTVTLQLAAGRYVFLCNLPSHYAQGMHTVITVN